MDAAPNEKLRILLIGTLTERVSGTSVNLRPLVNYLSESDAVELTFINTEMQRGGVVGAVQRVLGVMWTVFRLAPRHDIVTFHMNEPEKGIPIWLVTRLRRKPFLLRWFGGVDYRTHGSALRKACAKFMLRHADVNLFQTWLLVRQSEEDGSPCSVWFSNSRIPPDTPAEAVEAPTACKRFMFAGHVKPEKGVHELIAASERLPEGVTVDVHGPFFPGCSEDDFRDRKRIRYGGVLKPGEVMPAMREHDAVVLPTFFPGEGYPGVIIEAYFAGRPVICTDWLALSEIVDDTSGILVPPHNAEALRDAMLRMADDPALYNRLREGALAKRKLFIAERWAAFFVEVCRLLSCGDIPALRDLTLG